MNTRAFRTARWTMVWVPLLVGMPLVLAQSGPRAAAAPATTGDGAGLVWSQRTIRFLNAKPVLGLPLGTRTPMVRCGGDNTAFFNLQGDSETSGAAGMPLLYSISTDGEVKSELRTLPVEFNDLSVRDFFVSEQHVVTLLRATKRDDQGVQDTRYFLSKLDTQGDFKDMVQVEGHFRPVKIAVFDDGEVMVLGWDEANLLPMLAVLKDSGAIRYFLDVEDRKGKGAFDRGSVNAEMLEDAAFVAYGKNVLLTFPGTVKPALVMDVTGVIRTIPLGIPAGYILHDVLYSGTGATLVVRVQAKKEGEKPGLYDEAQDPQRRLFEMTSSGALLRELVPDKPKVSEVTCAAHQSLTAVFVGSVLDSDQAAATATSGTQAGGGGQLLVSSVRR